MTTRGDLCVDLETADQRSESSSPRSVLGEEREDHREDRRRLGSSVRAAVRLSSPNLRRREGCRGECEMGGETVRLVRIDQEDP